MAKSYVTKFTEYVNSNVEELKGVAKRKGVIVTAGETLQSLIFKINEINQDYSIKPVYERDENLPDIDELFSNDVLRLENGGEYATCAYFLFVLDSSNKVAYNPQYSDTFTANVIKGIWSDGEEISKSGDQVHTMQQNGIFTDSNGLKYGYLKIYSDAMRTSQSTYPTNTVEIINDYYKGNFTSKTNSSVENLNTFINYWRIVGSWSSSTNYISTLPTARVIVVDGFYNSSIIFGSSNYDIEKVVFNGEYGGTSLKVFSGSTTSSYNAYASLANLKILKLPTSQSGYTVNCACPSLGYLYIPNGVTTLGDSTYVIYAGWMGRIKTLHLGKDLIQFVKHTSAADGWYELTYVTVSEGAFGSGTTSQTLDFSKAYKLTRASVLNLINGLGDRTSTTANVLKLSPIAKSLVTDEEKAILTNKNWTLS